MSQDQLVHAARVCVWCGAEFDDDAVYLDRRTRCGRCETAVTDPPPTAAELEAAYGDWYRPPTERRFLLGVDSLLALTRGLLAARLDRIAPDGPILDVGAGDGILIDALRARGREATGLERDPTRDDLVDGAIQDVEGEWAAITFWHSLEHIPDPGVVIKNAARLLPSGGILAVAVPNNASLQATLFGDHWLHLDIPRHLTHFSTESLAKGLREAGFTVAHIGHFRAGQTVIGWLHGLVWLLPGHPDLYAALRRSNAPTAQQSASKRVFAIGVAVVLLPIAAFAALFESAIRRGGTIYMEARRD